MIEGNKICLNTSARHDLQRLPGIGKVLSRRIVDNRPYGNLGDLMDRVPTLGMHRVKNIMPHIKQLPDALDHDGMAIKLPPEPVSPSRITVRNLLPHVCLLRIGDEYMEVAVQSGEIWTDAILEDALDYPARLQVVHGPHGEFPAASARATVPISEKTVHLDVFRDSSGELVIHRLP